MISQNISYTFTCNVFVFLLLLLFIYVFLFYGIPFLRKTKPNVRLYDGIPSHSEPEIPMILE